MRFSVHIRSKINTVKGKINQKLPFSNFSAPKLSGSHYNRPSLPKIRIKGLQLPKISLHAPKLPQISLFKKKTPQNNNLNRIYHYAPPPSAREIGNDRLRDKIYDLTHKPVKLSSMGLKRPSMPKISLPRAPKIQLPALRMPHPAPKTARTVKIKTKKVFKAPRIQLPAVYTPRISRPKLPQFSVKGKFANISNSIKSRAINCYDFTMHYASFYGLRNESLIGIDITPNCIYLCKIDGLNGKRVLTSLTSVCMEGKFLTEDIARHSDEYANSLKDLIKENNIETKNVALSIPVTNSIVRTVTLPTLDDKEIEKALKYGALWNNLMDPDKKPEDYSIFYQVIRRNKSSESMDVLFVATKLSDVSIYTDIIQKSGLNPVIVDVRCFAINNAYNHKLNNPDGAGPSVFLEFGLEENYAMIIDGGGANITQIELSEVERLALIDDILDERAIDDFVLNYAVQVERIISVYQDITDCGDIKNLFVLSNVPQVHAIVTKLTKALENYTIAECNFFDCMKINDDFTISNQSALQNLSAWTAAIGTALRKIDIFGTSTANHNYPNMLPVPGNYAFVKRTNFTINALTAVATIAIAWFVTTSNMELNHKDRMLSQQLAKLDGVEESYNKLAANNTQLAQEADSSDTVIALMKDATDNQHKILAVYEYLNLVILDDVWLREVKFTAPDKLEITGGSTNDRSILEFIQMLNEGNQFSKVALRGMKEIREVSVLHADSVNVKTFQVESTLKDIPNTDYNNHMMAGSMNQGS